MCGEEQLFRNKTKASALYARAAATRERADDGVRGDGSEVPEKILAPQRVAGLEDDRRQQHEEKQLRLEAKRAR